MTPTAKPLHPRLAHLLAITALSLAAIAITLLVRATRPTLPPDPPPFDGDSTALHRTAVLPTLDTPLTPGQNAIWCAAFQLSWKKLQSTVTGAPLQPNPSAPADTLATVNRLNASSDPTPDLPPGSFYAAAGRVDQGILQAISRDLKTAFPNAPAPTFPNTPPDACVAYAYLQAAVTFPLPFFDDAKPLAFTDTAGRSTGIRAFGVRDEDDYAYPDLRAQPKLLYVGDEVSAFFTPTEFAVDLCRTSDPIQIVVAPTTPGPTLAALERKIATADIGPRTRNAGLGPNDTLLIPKIAWRILHHFREIEGQRLNNPTLPRGPTDLATLDIRFRLDRGGMELRAEAKHRMRPVPTHYHVNRPFLLYAKKRGAAHPFLAIWIANDELLTQAGDGTPPPPPHAD